MWFKLENLADSINIEIKGVIGSDAVKADSIKKALLNKSHKPINLKINSVGGSIYEGLKIYNILKNHKGFITATVDSIAASMGSIILMAADKILISKNHKIMIHDPSASFENIGADGLEDVAKTLRRLKEKMIAIYKNRTGLSSSRLSKMMKETTFLKGNDALKIGFADQVLPVSNINAILKNRTFDNVKFSSEYVMSKKKKQKFKAGATLADLLNSSIDDLVDNNTTRADIISNVADTGDIEPSTLNQILSGGINCPPLERLQVFADALDLSLNDVRSAAENDGCEYSVSTGQLVFCPTKGDLTASLRAENKKLIKENKKLKLSGRLEAISKLNADFTQDEIEDLKAMDNKAFKILAKNLGENSDDNYEAIFYQNNSKGRQQSKVDPLMQAVEKIIKEVK